MPQGGMTANSRLWEDFPNGRHVETAGYFCKARVAEDPDLFEGRLVKSLRKGGGSAALRFTSLYVPTRESHIIQRDEVSADDAIISIGS